MHTTLERLHRSIEEGLSGLDASATQQRPASDRWSIQQVTEHLLLTYSLTAENFEIRVAKGKATEARPSLKDRAGQLLVCTLGLFPPGRKAPEVTVPSATPVAATGEILTQRARTALERFDAAADAAERLFGRQPAITHPVLGPMAVGTWRRFHLVHGEHHLKQLKELRRSASPR